MVFAQRERWQQAEVSDRAWIFVPAGIAQRISHMCILAVVLKLLSA